MIQSERWCEAIAAAVENMKKKEIKEVENAYLVVPEEEIEVYNIHNLRTELFSLVETGTTKLIIDLSKVRYIDSSGLGVLVSLLKKMKEISGKIVLLNPTEEIMEILSLTSLARVFIIVDNMENAIENLR